MEDFGKAWERQQSAFTKSLRPLQKREYLCCAQCADEPASDEERFESCLKKCGQQTARIGELYLREATLFQVGGSA